MTFEFLGRKITVGKVQLAAGGILLSVILGIAGWRIMREEPSLVVDSDNPVKNETSRALEKSPSPVPSPTALKAETENRIQVYVTGCVKKPGIVELKKGAIINDAVEAAGGATAEADLKNINLVYRLNENAMLEIRSAKAGKTETAGVKGNEPGAEAEAGKSVKIVHNSGGVLLNESSDKAGHGKININRATAGELDTLPGIGEATAADIIAYREKNGLFSAIQDVMKVPRIKKSRFDSIKDLITVD